METFCEPNFLCTFQMTRTSSYLVDTEGEGGLFYVIRTYYEEWEAADGEIVRNLTSSFREVYEVSDAQLFLSRNQRQIYYVREKLASVMGILVLIFNLYLLISIAAVKELRSVKFLLLCWQASCDILSVSIGDFVFFVLMKFSFYMTRYI